VNRFVLAALLLVVASAARAGDIPESKKKPPAAGVQVGDATAPGQEVARPEKPDSGESCGQEEIDWDRLSLARSKTAHGDKLLKREEYVRAERVFRQAMKQEKVYPVAYLGLGAALVGQQRFDEALDVLHQTEECYLHWRDRVQHASLTMKKMNAEEEQAVRDLQNRLELTANVSSGEAPRRGQAARQIARARATRVENIGRMSRLLYDHPEDLLHIPAQVFYLEGVSNLRLGHRDRGIELLRICLLLDEKHPLAHYNLAVALFTRGQLQAAKTHLDAAVSGGFEPPKQFVHDLNQALPR
jgi:tetratricopeptide (TPR) repeat protein